MRLSIIIPTYNTEIRLVKRLWASLECQIASKDVEVIVVDDGSNGGYTEKLKALIREDDNIRLIRKVHSGPSATRNIGIDNATGDYITFIDSDDKVSDDFIEKALEYIDEYGTDVIYGCIEFIPDDGRYIQTSGNIDVFNGDDIIKVKEAFLGVRGRTLDYEILGSTCSRLYKKEVLNKVHFRENLVHMEDQIFNREILNKVQSVLIVPDRWYQYNRNPGSVLHSYELDECIDKIINYWNALKELNALENETCQSRSRVRALGLLYSFVGKYVCRSDMSLGEKVKLIDYMAHQPLIKDAADKLTYDDDQIVIKEKIVLFLVKNNMYKTLYCIVKMKNNEDW